MISVLLAMLGCSPSPAEGHRVVQLPEPVREVAIWPASGAGLEVVDLPAPRNLRRKTVFLMAGHANGPKDGNTGVHGQIEAEVVHDAVLDLARRLEALERFDIVVGRKGEARPSYGDRIRKAERVGADVFVELHTDSRGDTYAWARGPDGWVWRADDDAGFSVLYNEGSDVGPARRDLAVAAAESLERAGFVPYPGCHYGGLYDLEGTPGVFIDRRGLMMLRRPTMPSIIIETHNAKDFDESLRWREPRTHEAFAAAMADALTRFLGEPP